MLMKNFAIVMAPEGTRKKVEHFKTGFYFIAKGAGIPIIPCQFDFSSHEVRFLPPFMPTEDEKKDMAIWSPYLRELKEKIPSTIFNLYPFIQSNTQF
jgi:1-acyl-sn-glycerol-3-phosphate acyltransferase